MPGSFDTGRDRTAAEEELVEKKPLPDDPFEAEPSSRIQTTDERHEAYAEPAHVFGWNQTDRRGVRDGARGVPGAHAERVDSSCTSRRGALATSRSTDPRRAARAAGDCRHHALLARQ